MAAFLVSLLGVPSAILSPGGPKAAVLPHQSGLHNLLLPLLNVKDLSPFFFSSLLSVLLKKVLVFVQAAASSKTTVENRLTSGFSSRKVFYLSHFFALRQFRSM